MIRDAQLFFPAFGEMKLEVHDSLGTAEMEWRAFEVHAHGHPYQCFTWQANWYLHVGEATGIRPMIAMVRTVQGELHMVFPLALERSAGMHRLVGMGAPVCDYHAPLLSAEMAARLAPAQANELMHAIARLAGADYVLLTHIPPKVGQVPNPFGALSLSPFSANAHGVRLGSDWQAFFAERRTAKTRRRFREKEASLARLGPLAFEAVTHSEQLTQLVTEVVALKERQLRKTAGRFSSFSRPDVRSFYSSLAGGASQELVVFRLTVGGVLGAAAVGLVRNGCFYYQIAVFPDESMQRHSPGAILLHRTLEWAIARGCSRFDFTVGDEPYKAAWCDETWDLSCGTWPRTARGWLGARMALAQVALVRQVKRRPRLFAQAVRLHAAIGMVSRWRQWDGPTSARS